MLIFLFLIPTFILCLLFPKSKSVALLMFLFMWLLWGWNTDNGDYANYKEAFESIQTGSLHETGYEFGYGVVNYLFSSLGFSFRGFLIVYSFIVLGLIYTYFINSPYPAFMAAFYLPIFVMEYVFVRNFMIDALFFMFLLVNFSETNFKFLKSLAIFVMAAFFHTTAVIYLLFLLTYIKRLDTRKILFIVGGGIIFLVSSYTILLSFIDNELILGKIDYYSSEDKPIGPAIAHVFIIFITYLFLHYNKDRLDVLSSTVKRNIEVMQKVNIITLIYIPLYFFMPDFSRFFKILFTVNLFYVSYLFFYFPTLKPRLALIGIFLIINLFVLYQFATSTLKLTYDPLINSNIIFDF
ncbi:hypothetical protein B0E44_16305 [Flavobacterium sp. A45]|nr:hypothetical protein B0E44_16305 [Flavobacterium sp. A45]